MVEASRLYGSSGLPLKQLRMRVWQEAVFVNLLTVNHESVKHLFESIISEIIH